MGINSILLLIFASFFITNLQASWAKTPSPKLFKIYVRPHSKLTKISDQSEVTNERGFYVNALEVDPNTREEFYLYNKDGKAIYIVHAGHIAEIEEELHLLPDETGNTTYPPKSEFKLQNKIMPFETEFSFHLDSLNLSTLGEFLDNDVSNTTAPRFNLNTHFITLLPINVGFNLNYQLTSWTDTTNATTQLSNLSIGPDFKFRILQDENYSLSSQIAYEFSPQYSIKGPNGTDNFSAYLWSFALINEFKTEIGKINLGVEFRKHFLTFESSNRSESTLSPNEYSITSLGLSIGYNFNWEL